MTRAKTEEHRAHEPEEPERLLRELGQKEERRDVEQPPQVDPRAVDPGPRVVRVLGHRHFVHPVALAQRQGGDEPMEIAVQRQRLRDGSADDANPAGDIVEPPVRHAARASGETPGTGAG